MSQHPSLRSKAKSKQHRSVLKRYERVKGLKEKEKWDPTNEKKIRLKSLVESKLGIDFEVRVGGTTSIDVTMPGVDKAFGMKKLMSQLGLKKSNILFVGDRLQEGGNDYPIRAMGIDTIEVKDWLETITIFEGEKGE